MLLLVKWFFKNFNRLAQKSCLDSSSRDYLAGKKDTSFFLVLSDKPWPANANSRSRLFRLAGSAPPLLEVGRKTTSQDQPRILKIFKRQQSRKRKKNTYDFIVTRRDMSCVMPINREILSCLLLSAYREDAQKRCSPLYSRDHDGRPDPGSCFDFQTKELQPERLEIFWIKIRKSSFLLRLLAISTTDAPICSFKTRIVP